MSSPESGNPRKPTGRTGNARSSRARRPDDSATREVPPPPEQETPEDSTAPSGPASAPRPEQPFGWSFRDFLIPYILLALSVQRAHGYLIEQYLRGLGLANLEMSTLYRTLRQLERDGLVYSTWEPGPDGPARRIYSLTDTGRWWLDAGAATLASYRSLIDRFFGSYSGQVDFSRDED